MGSNVQCFGRQSTIESVERSKRLSAECYNVSRGPPTDQSRPGMSAEKRTTDLCLIGTDWD